VLACFAPASALSAALFGIWVRQVAPVRGAVLWLANHPKPLRKRLAGLAIAQGLPPQRLRFLDDTVNRDDALLLADLVLDTGRDEGAATLHEALANAVPSLTLTGPTALLRIGDSLLRATACSSLIAEDLPGYESRLAHLLRHPRELMACRDRLRRQRSAHGAALAQPAVHQPGALATALQARLEALWPDHE
jgi:predicted O-linked N-acetylglucosamine transferase (SPINDLY family)